MRNATVNYIISILLATNQSADYLFPLCYLLVFIADEGYRRLLKVSVRGGKLAEKRADGCKTSDGFSM
jgi:hypothetical protein